MSYTPLANEVIISGVNIGSGGQIWAGEAVVIPLNDVSNPAQFYVKSATDGSLIKVDPATAAQLYATSIAINDLNSLYGPGQAYSIPSTDWAPIANYAQTSFQGESLLNYIGSFVSQLPTLIPEAIGLAIPDIDVLSAAGIAETLISTYLTATTENANNIEFALADSLVHSASTLLNVSFNNYSSYIYDDMAHPGNGITVNIDQPVDYSTIYDTLYNTLISIDAGQAASDAISTLANGSLWSDLVGVAETALGLVPGKVGELIGDVAGVAGIFQAIAGSPNVNQFAASLQTLITAAENTALSSFALSSTAIANDETQLANSIAETQGEALGSTPTPGTETPTPTFNIVSSPTIPESAGKITFTIDETGVLSHNLTVYVSTLQNWNSSGVYNTATPGSQVSTNYYYDGLSSTPITFAATSASSSSQPISIAINPVGLASGSETFGFEIQEMNSSGQLYTVASAPFTIENHSSTTSGPTISSVTSLQSSGSVVIAGHSVTFTVTFSAPVVVNLAGGPPLLSLSDNETASYTGGSGTNALTFVYNVSPGDQSSDLQVTGLTIPNGSQITDLAGDAAVTAGATANTGVQINTTAPSVKITSTGGLVGSLSQTISGTTDLADAGTQVTIFDGANTIGTATVASNGAWTANVTLSVSGSNTIVAKDTNSAGNTGVSNSIIYAVDTASYDLTPANPIAQENQGSLVFTLTRTGDTSADTVFVQTDENHGSLNPNSEYFQEQNLVPVFFAQDAASATFAIPINDIHAVSGSQTFGLSIYASLDTSIGSLAATTFTIDDTDTNTGSLTGSIETDDTVTGTTTISSPVFLEARNSETSDILQNDGVIDIDSGGFIGGDNDYGTISNPTGSVININTADSSASDIDVTSVNNDGTINVSPGSGNIATIWTINGGISDTGAINVLSGTLRLLSLGSSSNASLNASGISIGANAGIDFEAGTFTVAGGTYNVAGSTIIGGVSTYFADVIFGAGTDVNVGGDWFVGDSSSLDLSAATLSGTFSSLTLSPGAYSLSLGSHNVTINDFNSSSTVISDSGIITLTGAVTTQATWSGGGTVVNEGVISSPDSSQAAGEITSGETFVNDGVVNNILLDSGAVLNNESDGTLSLYPTVLGTLNNQGVVAFSLDGLSNGALSGFLDNTGTIQFSNATSGFWNLSGGGSSSASGLDIDTSITLYFGGNAADDTFTITGGTFRGGGALAVLSGAELLFSSSTEVENPLSSDGTIEIANGALTVQDALTGTGTVVMDAGTTLALAAPQGFTNTISGFTPGSSIDLVGIAATNASIDGSDQLVVTDAGVTVATLQMVGDYPGAGLQFLVASDGDGGSTITLGVPSAPSLSAGAVVTFADSVAPTAVTIDAALSVIGGGSASLVSATVAISSGFQAGDILAATTTGTNIVASYDASTGTLSLSGTDTLTDYEAVLQSVTFDSVPDAQANGADPTRTITWSANDGTRASATSDSTIVIADAAPTVTALAAPTFDLGVSAPVVLDPTLAVSDIDNPTLTGAKVSIGFGFSDGDVLGVTTTGTAISVESNTAGVLTLTGVDTLADYEAVLRSVTFTTTGATQGGRVIVWSVNDGQLSSTLTTSDLTIADTTAPSVAFAGSARVVGDTITLSGTDSDDVGVKSVEIFNGATDLGAATLNSNGTWSFAATLAAGFYNHLEAVVTNLAGNTTTAQSSFSLRLGVAGEPYTSIEYLYNASAQLTEAIFTRANGSLYGVEQFAIANEPYARTVALYNASGKLTEKVFKRADNSIYLIEVVEADGGKTLTYEGITGKPYGSFEYEYASGGALTRAVFRRADGSLYEAEQFGIANAPYARTVALYSDSNQLTEEIYRRSDGSLYEVKQLAIANEPYARTVALYNDSNQLTEKTFRRSDGSLYQVVQFGIANEPYARTVALYNDSNRLTEEIFVRSDGSIYEVLLFPLAKKREYAASGALDETVANNSDGSRTITPQASGVTLAGTSDGSDEFFFKAGFGQDAISTLASHLTGAAHDTVSLAKSDFANFTALLADATFVGGAAVITAANHDALTLDGVTKAMLSAASGDFSFHA